MAQTPPENRHSVSSLRQIMAILRAPGTGCPWDLEQTHASIAPYAIEEAYEVVDAIERSSDKDLCTELGDLLLQVVFHAQMAEERGAFTFDAVVEAICTKMITRHPHVFGDAPERSSDEQTKSWEEIKAAERAQAATDAPPRATDGIPINLPALTRAEKIGKRVARLGFDWPTTDGVIDKIREELSEVEGALADGAPDAITEEIGDLLFSVANLTRYLDLDAEQLLRAANTKFVGRFAAVEDAVKRSGRPFAAHSLTELEAYWTAAKNAPPAK